MVQLQGQDYLDVLENIIVLEKICVGIVFEINGEGYCYIGDLDMLLLWYLCDVLQFIGIKYVDVKGFSGVDFVFIDGKVMFVIIVLMGKLVGCKVIMVEGLVDIDGCLYLLQQVFIDEDVIGCGYCIVGWLIVGVDLLWCYLYFIDVDIDILFNFCCCGCQSCVCKVIQCVGVVKGVWV